MSPVSSAGSCRLLRRLLPKLWQAFPGAAVRVCLDAGFASPAIFDLLEDAGVEYVVAMAKNPVLLAAVAPSLGEARTVAATTAQSARAFAATSYQATTWRQARRVIIKAEVVVHPGARSGTIRASWSPICGTPRRPCTRTSMPRAATARTGSRSCVTLALGRTSCTRFWANQLRVLLSAAAYVLTQTLQLAAAGTTLAQAQAPRLRQALLTIGVRVTRSVRRFVLHLPRSHPEHAAWHHVARALGAT